MFGAIADVVVSDATFCFPDDFSTEGGDLILDVSFWSLFMTNVCSLLLLCLYSTTMKNPKLTRRKIAKKNLGKTDEDFLLFFVRD